jgi:hypothetical protein
MDVVASQVFVSPFANCTGAAQITAVQTCYNVEENNVVTDVRDLWTLLRMRVNIVASSTTSISRKISLLERAYSDSTSTGSPFWLTWRAEVVSRCVVYVPSVFDCLECNFVFE